MKPAHFVTVRLRYMARQDGTNCSATNDPAWEAEGNSTEGGALPMALDHLAERQAEIEAAITSIQTSIQTRAEEAHQ